jgi:predicted PurR-regulated permease PerM
MDQRIRNIIIVVGIVLLLFLIYYFISIVSYILIAAALSLIGTPVAKKIRGIRIGKFRVSKTVSALLTLLILCSALLGFFWFFIPLVASEVSGLSDINVQDVINYIDSGFDQLRAGSPRLASIFPQTGNLNTYMQTEFANFLNLDQVSNVFNSVASAVGNFFLMFFSVSFILFFFLKEENLFGNLILLLVPTKIEDRVVKVFDSISHLLKRFMIGLLFQVLGVMVLSTIGFTIIGMGFSHAVIVGVFAGLLNVVPYIGPWIAASFGIIVVIANHLNANFNSVTLPLIFLVIVVVIIVQLIDNILFQPVIYSSSVRAHPLEIFIVILMAGSFAGILGMILAIPVYTVLRVIAGEFLSEFKVIRKLANKTD